MKLRLTNYDTSEYKQFEDMLNNLSKSVNLIWRRRFPQEPCLCF